MHAARDGAAPHIRCHALEAATPDCLLLLLLLLLVVVALLLGAG
jgi:hypothetical protein